MKPTYVYPGTFCPPHIGHVQIAKEAAKRFGQVTVVCSVNPDKAGANWFTPDECKEMWMAHNLGPAVKVMTFDEFMAAKPQAPIVMVRGIRDRNDMAHEKKVEDYNRRHHNIKHFRYIKAQNGFERVSSTAVRKAAMEHDFPAVAEMTQNERIARMVIEKAKEKR